MFLVSYLLSMVLVSLSSEFLKWYMVLNVKWYLQYLYIPIVHYSKVHNHFIKTNNH